MCTNLNECHIPVEAIVLKAAFHVIDLVSHTSTLSFVIALKHAEQASLRLILLCHSILILQNFFRI